MRYAVLDVKKTGKRIKELREEKNLSIEDVCEYMGFESVQAIYKWQRGDGMPSVDNLYALSRLFDTTVDDILCGDWEIEENGFS